MARTSRAAALLLAAAALAAQPVRIGLAHAPGLNAALAHGNGGGNGGGNGATGHADNANAGHDGPQSDGHADADGPAVANARGLQGRLHKALAALNAAHASHTALAHASPVSEVGRIAEYYRGMQLALAMPANTPAEVAERDQTIANLRSSQLALAANKSLSPPVVAQVDHLLGLPPSNPALGVTP